ncbi:MAG: DUF4115 domain-containing protein [Cyanobacteria bacterium REEB67]|nr:DUF4115 domain-containing protein [Cyanobacteria bacterium REEB67]
MSLEQIGQKLKATREGQSLSLGQIYDRTKIPPNHLEAIESGIADDLPETVYVAGFIKRYGDLLGLNGQSLADEYKRGSQPVEAGRGVGMFNAGRMATQQVSAPVVYVSKPRGSDAPGFAKTFFYPSLLLIAVIGVVCGLAAWYQSQLVAQQDPGVLALNQSASRFNNMSGGPIPATTIAAPNALSNAAVNGANPAAAQTPPGDSKISLSASQHVWVDVKSVATGASLFTGYLEMGDRRDFQDVQGLRVRAGNGASVSVAFNGASETMGAAGKVAEKVYAAPQAASAPGVAGVPGAAGTAALGTGTATAAGAKAVTPLKKPWVRKAIATDGTTGRSGRSRGLDSGGTRDIPGVSGGGSRSIDVPYRYNDGRLDND